jgi:DNA-directed RNA polymerase specialized sigma24 family protein
MRRQAHQAISKLTEIQRRRYIQYHVDGLSTWAIAELEGVNQKSVYESIQAAEKKIKKYLAID